jgi:hypothetical protein
MVFGLGLLLVAAATLTWAAIERSHHRENYFFRHLTSLRAIDYGDWEWGEFNNVAAFEAIITANLWLGLALALGGMLLLGVSVRGRALLPVAAAARTPSPPMSRLNGPLLLAGILLLAVTTLAQTDALRLNIHLQFGAFAAGVMLVAAGWSGLRWHLPRWRLAPHHLLLIAISGLALGLRTWRLETAVLTLVDEYNAIGVLNRLEHHPGEERLLLPALRSYPYTAIYSYLQTQVVVLFGHSIPFLRLGSAVIGTLTIPATYALAREIFDRRTGLLAAFLLAVFPPHIHFSRIGLNNIVDPLLGVLLFLFILRGMRSNRRADFVLAGVCLGLTQYFYDAGRLFYPVLLVLWLSVTLRRPVDVERRQLGWTLLAGLVVAAPALLALLLNGEPFSQRANESMLPEGVLRLMLFEEGALVYLRHLSYGYLMYFYMPDGTWFYADEYPLLMPLLLILFLTGLACCLAVANRRRGALLLVMAVGLLPVGTSLLLQNASAQRFVVVYPLLAVVGAVGMRLVMANAGRRWGRGLAVLWLALLGFTQVNHYFTTYAAQYPARLHPHAHVDDLLLRFQYVPDDSTVMVVGKLPVSERTLRNMLEFFQKEGVSVRLREELNRPEQAHFKPRDMPILVFIDPRDTQSLGLLAEMYRLEGPFYSRYAVARERQFRLYYVIPWRGE